MKNSIIDEKKTSLKQEIGFKRILVRVFRLICFITVVYSLTIGVETIYRVSPLFLITSLHSSELNEATFNRTSTIDSIVNVAINSLPWLIILFCLIKRRFFCRYICPLGAMLDSFNYIRRKLFKNRRFKQGVHLKTNSLFLIIASFWAITILLSIIPLTNNWISLSISPTIFDPMSIISKTIIYFPIPPITTCLFIICFIFSPFFWRFQFCPCGVLQELLFLPRRLFQWLIRTKERPCKSNNRQKQTRRGFFEKSGAFTLGLFAFMVIRNLSVKISAIFFRPPGTFDEHRLLSRCAKCGKCVDICPTQILQPVKFKEVIKQGFSPIHASLLSGTPKVEFNSGYCDESCVECSNVCPTQAIQIKDIADKRNLPIALAIFNLEKCFLYYGRECSICRRECPYQAINFQWSDEAYANIPVINNTKCVGCGRCVAFCPGEPIDDLNACEITEQTSSHSKREKALSLTSRLHS